nr:hypothetical protein [Tanacetum cinerariifolium]
RKDNAAAELRIRVEANEKLAQLDAAQADVIRQRRAKELSDEAQYYSLLADGMLAGLNQGKQQQVQASERYKQQRIAAVLDEQDARLAVVATGSQDEINIRQDTENKLRQIQQDSHQAQLDLLQQQTAKIASIVTSSLSSLSAIQDADSQAKLARLDAEMNKEGFRAIDSAKFAEGGIAYGPSHAQGGIQLHQRGRHVGIEIEGGEAIINKRSTALFGPVLSAINQLGGGRPFYTDPLQGSALMARLAVGGVVPANLPDYLPQVRTAGVV